MIPLLAISSLRPSETLQLILLCSAIHSYFALLCPAAYSVLSTILLCYTLYCKIRALCCKQARLREKQVPFGPAGFELADIHTNINLLSILIEGVLYSGYLDGVAIPYGALDFAEQMRLGIELKPAKWSQEQSGKVLACLCLRL